MQGDASISPVPPACGRAVCGGEGAWVVAFIACVGEWGRAQGKGKGSGGWEEGRRGGRRRDRRGDTENGGRAGSAEGGVKGESWNA